MASAAEKTYLTPEQYLALERRAETKSEYYHGEMFAMAGASREHNLIAHNLNRALGNQLLDRPCETYASDMRVLIEATGLYTYPDVVVACGEPEFEDREGDTLLNPTVLFEVLSPSTEAYDRGRKFDQYRTLESLSDYVMVAQDRPFVLHYARRGDQWVLSTFENVSDSLLVDSIGVALPLSEIYLRVEFPSQDEPNRAVL